MKYIIIVPDGMADHPLEELKGKTPLEVAHTANMDFMAKEGKTGMVQTIPRGMPPGSDIGNMALLGYDPRTCHSGRAPLEAANLKITLKEDEIAFRCNLVTIIDGKMVDYSAGHIPTRESSLLIEALNKEIDQEEITFYPGIGYRHILVLKVRNPEKYKQLKTVPPHDILNKKVSSYLPQGPEAQLLLKLMEMAKKIFKDHPVNQTRVDLNENPANTIWLWGQGTRPALPLFKDKFGIQGAIISAVDLVNGIGRLAGLNVITVPGATGYYDTDYTAKAAYALKALQDNDLVYIHVEAPDEAGHNGDFKAKIQAIENIDRKILGPMLDHFNEGDDYRVLVLPDHPTPVALRTHTHEPVGFVMYGKGIPTDGNNTFNERLCKEKGLTFASGEELISYFLQRYLT